LNRQAAASVQPEVLRQHRCIFIAQDTPRLCIASEPIEDLSPMPTTQHAAAAERHMQAAHAHEAAAASHTQNDHLGAHEQSRLAQEHSREAHLHSEQIAKSESEKK
jgi:hypothetical protein